MKNSGTVVANEFELRTNKSTCAARLYMNDQELPSLESYDSNECVRAVITIDPDGTPKLSFLRMNGELAVGIAVDQELGTGFTIGAPDGKGMIIDGIRVDLHNENGFEDEAESAQEDEEGSAGLVCVPIASSATAPVRSTSVPPPSVVLGEATGRAIVDEPLPLSGQRPVARLSTACKQAVARSASKWHDQQASSGTISKQVARLASRSTATPDQCWI